MLTVLRNPTYARLFSAQVIGLLGTGLLTVALGLLAFDIAGADAGVVLGIAMTIKMVAYVAVAPVISALTLRVPRKTLLISADVARALTALALPFVTQAWQIYVLIFVLQAASATFTPAFQTVIPSVLPCENDYTRALSLSRMAYDLETLLSPVLAALLLTIVSYHSLIMGTVFGFGLSALLVYRAVFPPYDPEPARFLHRLIQGIGIFWRDRELRGLMGLNLSVAAVSSLVIVNSVVLVQGSREGTPAQTATLLAAFGAGSMLVALILPGMLRRLPDRRVMLVAGFVLPVLLVLAAPTLATAPWFSLLLVWFLLGAAASFILTPSARLIRRATDERSRPAVFAAQFSLSHACFLLTYPVAGIAGASLGLAPVALMLAALGLIGAGLAAMVWR